MKNTESFSYILNKKVGDKYDVEIQVGSEKEFYNMIAGIIGSYVLQEAPFDEHPDDGALTGTEEADRHHEIVEAAIAEIKSRTYSFLLHRLFHMFAKEILSSDFGGSEDDGDDLL